MTTRLGREGELEVMREIMGREDLNRKEKVALFKEKTGKTEKTYYNHIQRIEGVYEPKTRGSLHKSDRCYFCNGKENLIPHHIDRNPNNNKKENVLTLCERCHRKTHIFYQKYLDGLLDKLKKAVMEMKQNGKNQGLEKGWLEKGWESRMGQGNASCNNN